MPPLNLSAKPSRQVRRALARQSPEQQNRRLSQTIVAQGAARAAEAAQAKTITHGHLTDAEVLAWRDDLQARLRLIEQDPEKNLGYVEEEVAAATKDLQRVAAQRSAQAKANATACLCRNCQRELTEQQYLRRGVDSRFGHFDIWRRYGWCPKCQEWQFPADHALGLAKKAAASPYVQEISALLVTKMPPDQAVAVAERLGLDLSRCLLHREAHRQGLKALDARAQMVAELATWEDLQRLVGKSSEEPPTHPFTLVVEIDAWNIRERDDWGQTKALRKEGKKVERWHWVYMGTVFRMDHRGQTDGQRAVITQRGFVATRHGIEALVSQLYREALERGLCQAQQVLVIADGAVWIWNLVQDRFPHARQRLDLWHGEEHLWAVANDLYGKGTPEAAAWVAPLLQQVRADQTPEMIQSLKELLPRLNQGLQEKLQKQIDYFADNANRMKYKEIIEARQAVEDGKATPEQIRLANEPLGSGAIESTCRQYQCRFKRTGQFWTTTGDEALMCLETFWRNGRWQKLYPHAKSSAALN